MLSIPSYKSEDPNYRYKMPKLVAKVEGRGNGIKTNIVNMGDIARALKRPPEYATRFCGHELGTSSKFESNEGKAIVNGAHEQRDLQALIDKFIDKFVLCQKCSLPEIDLELRSGRVGYNCNACGDRGEVDNSHKLSTFILRNPPEGADTTCGGGGNRKLTREERQKAKAAKQAAEASMEGKKQSSRKKKKDSEGSEDVAGNEGIEVEDDGEEKKHRKQKDKKKKKKSKEDEGEKPIDELNFQSPEVEIMMKMMVEFCTTKKDEGEGKRRDLFNDSISGSEFYRELNLVRITNGAPQRVAFFVALRVLFHDSFGLQFNPLGVEKRAPWIGAVARSMKAREALAAFEEFAFREGMKQFPYLLQKLYDEDIVDDKDLMRRYCEGRRKIKSAEDETEAMKAARAAAQPFITWLAESEGEENDDDEEEDDDLDKAERQRLGNVTMKSLASRTTAASAKADEDKDDENEIEDDDDENDDEDDDEGSDIDVDAI